MSTNPAWGEMGKSLLAHVTSEVCTDADCEIHNIEVGVQEETVSYADQAFWLAGFMKGWEAAVRRISRDIELRSNGDIGDARSAGIAKLSR